MRHILTWGSEIKVRVLDASSDPSGENDKDEIHSVCPSRVFNSVPSDTLHRRIFFSYPAEASIWPSGENWTSQRTWVPLSIRTDLLSQSCHKRTEPSCELEANILPSGEKHNPVTWLVCPSRWRSNLPSATFQTRIFFSFDPAATNLQFGEKATHVAVYPSP